MRDWKTYKLKDLVEIKNGYAFKGTDFISDGIPVIKIKNVKPGKVLLDNLSYVSREIADKSQRFRIQPDDILITMSGNRIEGTPETWVGKVGLFKHKGEYLLNQRVGILKVKDLNCVSISFLSLLLSSEDFQYHFISKATSSGGQANISPSLIYDTEITIPPIEEQKAIAKILSSLDDKIELNRQMNATLEAMARAVFKAWFVDFEPVRANSERRPSQSASPEIAKLFPSEFENDIPKGWQNGTVADLGKVICGKTPSTKIADNFGVDIPFITIPDMHGKVFVTQTARYLSNKGADTQGNKYLPAKSICVSCIATAGLVALSSETSQTNQQINSVIPNKSFGTFYSYQVLDKLGQEIRTKGSGGSVFVNLNTGSFSRIAVLLPKDNCAKAYNDLVNPIFEKILNNEKENQQLAEIRDSLLPRLISGKIRVGEAEKF